MEILPTMLVSDGKQSIRINVSDEAAWAQRGFVKDAEESKPLADRMAQCPGVSMATAARIGSARAGGTKTGAR